MKISCERREVAAVSAYVAPPGSASLLGDRWFSLRGGNIGDLDVA
jgi:hypothetical protein